MDVDKPDSNKSNDHGSDSDRTYWLDDPSHINLIVYALYATCALLILADLFYHKHVHFDFESWFGFYGFFGFAAFTGIVFAAKILRILVKRDEDYYDR